DSGWAFLTIDLDGKLLARHDVTLAPEQATDEAARQKAIAAAVGPEKPVRFADQTIAVTDGGKLQAYLLPGGFPGFKGFVKVMLALSPDLTIRGLEIMEQEEDPGLGAEIAQDYFKNQFQDKDFEHLKKLEVAKVPLPDEYRAALEAGKTGRMGPEQVAAVESKYKDKDIYALTGATISSRAVTSGVKGIVKKFAYRLAILDRIIKEQGIAVPF
ncbi:MAG: FMN-binding protein, partial [Desulfobacteraceae bacterium]|nr:FMN-binding protein [Desulfobacteraceae bacterium]